MIEIRCSASLAVVRIHTDHLEDRFIEMNRDGF